MQHKPRVVPPGYNTVTPYLVVDDAGAALEFYRQAFGARERLRLPFGERVFHAEIEIGDSTVMLADEAPELGALSPRRLGATTASLFVYVEDVDAVVARAIAAGATLEHRVEKKFYGDRTGTVIDPFGHRWSIATHVEDVRAEVMARRMEVAGAAG